MQRQSHGVGAHQPGAVVINGIGRKHRRAVASAAPHLHSAGALRQLLPPRPLRPWPIVSESVQRGVHNVRLDLFHGFIAQPHAFHGGLAVVLHDDIRGFHQLPENFPPLLGFEVEHNAALAPVHINVTDGIQDAGRVVNFDDIGAELAQCAPASRAGQYDAQVKHADALQSGHNVPVPVRRRRPRIRRIQLRQHGVGMLAKLRRAGLNGAGSAAQPYLHTGLLHPAVFGVINLNHHLAGNGVLVNQPLVHRLADGAGAALRVDVRFPLPRRAFFEHCGEPFLPHCQRVGVNRAPKEGYRFVNPFLTAGGGQSLAGEPLKHPVMIDPAAISALIRMRHHGARKVKLVNIFVAVELDDAAAHRREHCRM